MRSAASLYVVALILAGCAVGPDYRPPDAPADTRFTEAPLPITTVSARTPGGSAQMMMTGRDIPGEWWEVFHSNNFVKD